MKIKLILLLLLGALLISSNALAQEQAAVYSGFNRFFDNVKLFFSNDEKKVKLALEIREKEINSALNAESNNLQNENNGSVLKNLERARKKLLIVQQKVSADIADEVKANINNLVNKVTENENLSKDFEVYILEEKKTQLTAELVAEVGGNEGQTLKREIVKDEATGQNKVEIVVNLDDGEKKIIELKDGIAQLENEIAERVVARSVEGEGEVNDSGKIINTNEDNDNKGDGAKIEIKKDGPDTMKNDPLTVPDLNKINPDLYDPNAKAPGDTIDDTYDDDVVNKSETEEKHIIDP